MEDIIDVYLRPYDPLYPVVCIDEMNKQLLAHVKDVIPMKKGQPQKEDYHYKKLGTCAIFMFFEPLAGIRYVEIRDNKKGPIFAEMLKLLAEKYYPYAKRITLIMDNYSTHHMNVLYKNYDPAVARRIVKKFEIHRTPVHASWLNVVEPELGIMSRQCLNRRIDTIKEIKNETLEWQRDRNNANMKLNWQFTSENARTKLKHLYPIYISN